MKQRYLPKTTETTPLLENITSMAKTLNRDTHLFMRVPLMAVLGFVLVIFGFVSALSFFFPSISASPNPFVTLIAIGGVLVILALLAFNKGISDTVQNITLLLTIAVFGVTSLFNGIYPSLLMPIAIITISLVLLPNRALLGAASLIAISVYVSFFTSHSLDPKATVRLLISNLAILFLMQIITRQRLRAHLESSEIQKQLEHLSELLKSKVDSNISEAETIVNWVMDASEESFWDWRLATNEVFHNHNWFKTIGYTDTDLTSTLDDFIKILHPDDRSIVLERVQTAIKNHQPYYSEHRLLHKNGEVVWVLDRGKVIEWDDQGAPLRMIGSFADITHLKINEQTIKHLAYFDQLTNMPNRRFLEERLKEFIKEWKLTHDDVLVILLDIDDFKLINDTRGHDVGDELLQQVAQRIKSTTRISDFSARLGGDEFVIIVKNDRQSAEVNQPFKDATVERIKAALHAKYPLQTANITYNPTFSLGSTTLNNTNATFEEILKECDLALYSAKAAGINTAMHYTTSMRNTMERRAILAQALHHATFGKELFFAYQAIVDKDFVLQGYELLIRLSTMQHGDLFPDELMPVARDTHIIYDIGFYAFDEAVELIGYWSNTDKQALRLSINICLEQLLDSTFIARVKYVVRRSNVDPKRITIEITEDQVYKNIDVVRRQINELASIGIKFALDDFGTGFSSLSRLKELPVEYVKIDKSFVQNISENNRDLQVVSGTIKMAHALNLKAVAEGVETEAQFNTLRELGCDFYQGYYIAKPLTKDMAFGAILKPDGLKLL